MEHSSFYLNNENFRLGFDLDNFINFSVIPVQVLKDKINTTNNYKTNRNAKFFRFIFKFINKMVRTSCRKMILLSVDFSLQS